MCQWGVTEEVEVTIPPGLCSTGEAKIKKAKIDKYIAPIVRALENAGIHMTYSCCGHGKGPGEIVLADGRRLVILQTEEPHSTRRKRKEEQ